MASIESREATEGSGSQVAEKAQEVAGQMQEKVGGAAEQAKDKLRTQVDTRSTDAGERISSTASDVRSVADQLRQQGKHQPAKIAEQAAQRADRLGEYLKQSDGDRILRDVEDAARQRPWAVMAGGIAVGIVASRLLKASSTERYRSSYGGMAVRTRDQRSLVGNGYSANPIGSSQAAVGGAPEVH